MDITEIRKLHLPVINNLLYFSNDDSSERKRVYEDIFVKTWDNIPPEDRNKILENLDFILCKQVNDLWHNDTPACALFNKINHRCFVIFNPFSTFIENETKIHILAHELSHVYYNHPRIGFELGSDNEKSFIKETAEPEAYALTEKWKIIPHTDDINKLPGYRKYVLKEKL
jgi:hypothetical protein